jgi:hypothetical protein
MEDVAAEVLAQIDELSRESSCLVDLQGEILSPRRES